MVRIFQPALVALPLGLLMAGCTGSHSSEGRAAQATRSRTAEGHAGATDRVTTDDTKSRVADRQAGPTTRPDQVLGYAIAPESRYDVSLDEIRAFAFNNAAVMIDARSPAAFARGRVRGAFNLPAGQLESYFTEINKSVPRDRLIIIYCNNLNCGSADMVYEYLAARGYSNMRVFKPGWTELSKANDLR